MAEIDERTVQLEAVDLGDAPGAGGSTQPGDERLWTPTNAIEPPEDLTALMELSSNNSDRGAIIQAVALNTVGLGYSVVPREGMEQEVEQGEGTQIQAMLERAAARDDRLDNPTVTELFSAVKTDEESCGNGAIEISRNRLTGEIDGLYHLPGHLLRRLADRTGFTVGRRDDPASERERYYNFGQKVQYDEDGLPVPKVRPGKKWAINEVLRFRIYTPESRDYGLPRDVALAMDYAGDRLVSESNVGFFDSGTVPPTVLFVQGSETEAGGKITFKVPDKTVERIQATLESSPTRNKRVALVPVPAGTDVNEVKLGDRSERDMGFTEYRTDNTKRKLSAFRLSPVFLSATDQGRYDAEVQRALTLEQLFDPEQRRYEARLRRIITDMGYPTHRLLFKRVAVEADAARRDSADKMAEQGTITNGEHRKAHGFAPLPEAADGEDPAPGQVPHGWNSELIDGSPPPGAENRTPEGVDDRGLRAGLGGRTQKEPPSPAQREAGARVVKHDPNDPDLPEHVEQEADDLALALVESVSPNGGSSDGE